MLASLSLVLCATSLVAALPYYLPQQRQLFYPIMPQYPQYSTPLAALPYRQYFYPHQSANLVAPVAPLRYPAPVAAPAKQVFYYPGAAPYPYVVAGDENSWSYENFISGITNFFTNQEANQEASVEGADTGSAPLPEKPAEAEAGAAEASEQTNKGGDKEKESEKPAAAQESMVKGVPQQFAVFGQPQYFGNLGLQRVVNPAMVLPSAQHGAVSSYLFLKNIPGVRFANPVPQVPQAVAAPQEAQAQPGQAALDYEKLLRDAQAERQQKDFDDSSVTVDAEAVEAALKDASEDKPEAEKESEDEETGTANE